ncbi:MAG: ABC transporter ATP-binding protein [Actinomycetia bacterium]|nr:ABC transporter ATP-binding protein [Actinomycetes bacterium]
MSESVVRIDSLRVELDSGEPIVEEVSLKIRPGEVLGLVGESGSGKTTTALALLGYARRGCRIASGTVEIDGHVLTAGDEHSVRALRGRVVSYIPQDPATSLNPSHRVGNAVGEMLRTHVPGSDPERGAREALERVHLPGDRAFRRRFPHQLSGGQRQRVAIASALVCEPPAVVMDEPTTGLDVVTQARILEEIDRLRREDGLAVLYVSHDLAVVASIADHLAVMYAGSLVEDGAATDILTAPSHPYTRGLIASIPDHAAPRRMNGIPGVSIEVGARPPGCVFAPRCSQQVARCQQEMPGRQDVAPGHRVRCFEWQKTPSLSHGASLTLHSTQEEAQVLEVVSLRAEYGSRATATVAVEDVTFNVSRGECVALVGESGSGKTTIARCVVGLHPPAAGSVRFDGEPLAALAKNRPQESRRRIQIVFQDPYESLNPRHRIRDAIARPARVLRGVSRQEAEAAVAELLERARLPAALAERFPAELSGGERQRVAIARALVAQPDLIVCDEITSALDVSVQAAVLDLLAELRAELGLSLLFISHDLGVVAGIADRVLVLDRGRVREEGPVSTVVADPQDVYTQELLAAAPRLEGVASPSA